MVDIYNTFGECKIIKKVKIEEQANKYGLSEYLVKKYSGKETAKQYSMIDNDGLVKALCNKLDNKPMSIIEQIKFEQEMLGYINYMNPQIPNYFWIVTEFKTYQNKSKPYITVRNLNNGETIKTKVKRAKVFDADPFELYSILIFEKLSEEHKGKYINNKWVEIEETEPILNTYDVLRKEVSS
jgi:DNA polymerase-3 subunit alpha